MSLFFGTPTPPSTPRQYGEENNMNVYKNLYKHAYKLTVNKLHENHDKEYLELESAHERAQREYVNTVREYKEVGLRYALGLKEPITDEQKQAIDSSGEVLGKILKSLNDYVKSHMPEEWNNLDNIMRYGDNKPE